jgi:hypothetical protein
MARPRIKPYKIHHETPFSGDFKTSLRFILLPYGYLYGEVPENAREGALIEFLNEDKAEIKSVCKVPLDIKLAKILCYIRYEHSLQEVFNNWVDRACMIGAERSAISEQHCLLVWHGEKI